MARYTGPKARISRRFNEPILGDNKALQKKNYPPGMHGKGKKRKLSELELSTSNNNGEEELSFERLAMNRKRIKYNDVVKCWHFNDESLI